MLAVRGPRIHPASITPELPAVVLEGLYTDPGRCPDMSLRQERQSPRPCHAGKASLCVWPPRRRAATMQVERLCNSNSIRSHLHCYLQTCLLKTATHSVPPHGSHPSPFPPRHRRHRHITIKHCRGIEKRKRWSESIYPPSPQAHIQDNHVNRRCPSRHSPLRDCQRANLCLVVRFHPSSQHDSGPIYLSGTGLPNVPPPWVSRRTSVPSFRRKHRHPGSPSSFAADSRLSAHSACSSSP